MDWDVIIIGGGPAGLSAATVLGRCLRRVLICDDADHRNKSSGAMHRFLTRDGVAPQEFLSIARYELNRYDTVAWRAIQAQSARTISGGFKVSFKSGATQTTRKLLLATGVKDVLPDILGIDDFYGLSVHHCPYCDGFEHRGTAIVVIGDNDKGVGLAKLMRQWSKDVTLCSNGYVLNPRDEATLKAIDISIITDRIISCEGENGRLRAVILEDGRRLVCSALFFNTDQTQRSHLLEELGCRFDDKGGVETNEREESCVPGLYVAGDASRDLQFVIMAAAEGARAAVAINTSLVDERHCDD